MTPENPPPDTSKPEEEELFAKMESELMLTIPHDNPRGKTLYHYTDSTGLEGIIRERKLRASHFRHMNDRKEFFGGEELVNQAAKALVESGDLTETQAWFIKSFVLNHELRPLSTVGHGFIASLSEERDQLSQ